MPALDSLWTPRLCLRSWRPGDVDVLSEAIGRNLDHLRPWLPWAEHEPIDRMARLEWIRHVQLAFDVGAELYFGIWSRGDGSLLGGHGLHRTAPDGPYETGYWVSSAHLRQGIAREATSAVTRYALLVKRIPELLIRIRPANLASGRVAESLGFRGPFDRITPLGDRCGQYQKVRVYTLSALECEQAAWRHDPLEWTDRRGNTYAL